MNLAATFIYWLIVALWLAVLVTLCASYLRNPKTFGAMRLLLAVLLIDTVRNLLENLYFGIYWGGRYGVFPEWTSVLGNPLYLMSMKGLTVVAAAAVLFVLSIRWLPMAMREWKSAEDAIRQKDEALSQEIEERRRLFENSVDVIIIADRNGFFRRVSPSITHTLGFDPEDLIGRSATDLIFSDQIEEGRTAVRRLRQTGHIRNFECRCRHKNGKPVPMDWSGVWSKEEQRFYFIGRDMTEQMAAEDRLKHLALNDPLTALGNRSRLHEDLGQLLKRPGDTVTAIAMLDLDGFKDINDTLGHSVGDALLKAVATRMQEGNDGGNYYRLGGDEFVLVLPDCADPLVISGIVDRLLGRLAKHFSVEGHQLLVTASAGIAIAPNDGASVDELVSSADLALYDAKANGGRCSRFFLPQLRARAESRRSLEGELRRAISENEFELFYQPQIRSRDGAVSGAEALLRWRHPEHGLLSPASFIEALADSPHAPELGHWIVTEACKEAASWRDQDGTGPTVAVNLFPAQFRANTLLRDVDDALATSGLHPSGLELEITENIALDNGESVLEPLVHLRARGVGIAFDDFGTGYASLSCLTRYPLTRIKIDRAFVSNVVDAADLEGTAIVRSIIAMARNLGLDVTAEGVETAAQATFLRAEGCHDLQGYVFSKPMPAENFRRFLFEWRAANNPAQPQREARIA
ncbi:MAG: hypothetical protein Rhirs2KO_20590 [Rhizobiaceae bacterium]